MEINLNAKCKVQLTCFGRSVLVDYYEQHPILGTPEEAIHKLNRPDEKGYLHFQLWELFLIFGPRFHIGMREVPFFGNVVHVDD